MVVVVIVSFLRVVVGVRRFAFGRVHVEFRGPDSGAHPVVEAQLDAFEPQRREAALERIERHAQIEKGADRHVSGNAREGVEVGHFRRHGSSRSSASAIHSSKRR